MAMTALKPAADSIRDADADQAAPVQPSSVGGRVKAIRFQAVVNEEGQLTITSPHLAPGLVVDVDVTLAPVAPEASSGKQGFMEWLDSLEPIERSDEEWAEWERDLRENR